VSGACERSRKWRGAGRKSVERSSERTFQKIPEWEWSMDWGWEAAEEEQSGERAKSVAQSPLTPKIMLI